MYSTQTLYYRDAASNSDKVYVAILEGDVVTFQWGRRGANLQSKQFGPMSTGAAAAMFDSKLAEKRAKGYREAYAWEKQKPSFSGPPPICPDCGLISAVQSVGRCTACLAKYQAAVQAPPSIKKIQAALGVAKPAFSAPAPPKRPPQPEAAKPVRKFRFADE